MKLCTLLTLMGITYGFNLHILHTNDVHAHVEAFSKWGGSCDATEANDCFGGAARRLTAVIQHAKSNTLMLDAGDQFFGTNWYNKYEGEEAMWTMNAIGYNAMAVGNHEFDGRGEGINKFMSNIAFPLLSANIEVSQQAIDDFPNLAKLKKSVVLDVDGQKVGIIGYTTSLTASISKPPAGVTFVDEITAVQAEADRLTAEGVKMIIALGHVGVDFDVDMAEQLTNVDVIVGGGSDTFLYNGDPEVETGNEDAKPSSSMGAYPLMNSDESTCIVHAYKFGLWLGNLNVEFDADGNVVSCTGNPILMDDSYAEESDLAAALAPKAAALEAETAEVIGQTGSDMTQIGKSHCRTLECGVNNFVADMILEHSRRFLDISYEESEARIAFINAGGIKNGLNLGDITIGDVKSLVPYNNYFWMMKGTGALIKELLEHSVSAMNPKTDGSGKFMVPAGLRYEYDQTREVGQRMLRITVACNTGSQLEWCPLDLFEDYTFLVSDYIGNGGDGYSMLEDLTFPANSKYKRGLFTDYEAVVAGIKARTYGLAPTLDQRIIAHVPTDSFTSERLVTRSMADHEALCEATPTDHCGGVCTAKDNTCVFDQSNSGDCALDSTQSVLGKAGRLQRVKTPKRLYMADDACECNELCANNGYSKYAYRIDAQVNRKCICFNEGKMKMANVLTGDAETV